jgi:hypothetical protein
MFRSVAALACFSACLFGAPRTSQAGIIPWMYDAIFGYGHHQAGWGYGGGWGMPYGGYMTGYAPAYPVSYAAPMGGACCGATTNYAPWYDSSGCCSPCGISPCGGCDSGCAGGNCPGGNCGTTPASTPPSQTPSTGGSGATPTYANPATPPATRTLPEDQFRSAPARDRTTPGSNAPQFNNNFGTGGSTADPNLGSPGIAPADPGTNPRRGSGNEDMGTVPQRRLDEEKVAFRRPAHFTRTNLQPVFELPTIVTAPERTPAPAAAPTAVASK